TSPLPRPRRGEDALPFMQAFHWDAGHGEMPCPQPQPLGHQFCRLVGIDQLRFAVDPGEEVFADALGVLRDLRGGEVALELGCGTPTTLVEVLFQRRCLRKSLTSTKRGKIFGPCAQAASEILGWKMGRERKRSLKMACLVARVGRHQSSAHRQEEE